MLRHAIPIERILGISIDLDYSWFLVFGLMTWILAVSYYPAEYKNWSVDEYWFIGAITAVMLFVSVLLRELGLSVVAQLPLCAQQKRCITLQLVRRKTNND